MKMKRVRKTMSCPNSPIAAKICRLVVLGSSQSGKTAIVNRFLKNEYNDSYVPTIEDFHRRLYRIRGELYQLDIVDSSGNDPFPAARRLSLATGDLFILVCSADRPGSSDQVVHYLNQINDIKGQRSPPPMVVAVNKIDIQPQHHDYSMNLVDGPLSSLTKQSKLPPMHMCSAKKSVNIKGLFADLFNQAQLPEEMNLAVEGDDPNPTTPTKIIHRRSEIEGSVHESPLNNKHSPLYRLKSKRSAPLTIFDDPDARRPSLRTDLLIMKAKKRGNLNHSVSPSFRQKWFSSSADSDHTEDTVQHVQTPTTHSKCIVM